MGLVGLAPPASAGHNSGGGSCSANSSGNVVLTPSVPTTPLRLDLFIPGTRLKPTQSCKFLLESQKLGIYTIGVAYENSSSVQALCGKNNACYGATRREIVFGGGHTGSAVSITTGNSIEGRLTAAINNAGWGPLFLAAGKVDWPKVIASGHSQGAGHAAILGLDRNLARVVLLAGPNELAKKKLPAWVTSPGVNGTPIASWHALSHTQDDSSATQNKAWDKFGLPAAGPTIPAPISGKRLSTNASFVDSAHLSVVVDANLGGGGTPTLLATWDALLTGP